MIDVAVAIDEESVAATLLRAAAGSYTSGGRYVAGADTSTAIRMCVQPMNGRQLMDVPEGVRDEAKFVGWSRTALVTTDRVQVGSTIYKIVFTWPRPADGFTRVALGLMA